MDRRTLFKVLAVVGFGRQIVQKLHGTETVLTVTQARAVFYPASNIETERAASGGVMHPTGYGNTLFVGSETIMGQTKPCDYCGRRPVGNEATCRGCGAVVPPGRHWDADIRMTPNRTVR